MRNTAKLLVVVALAGMASACVTNPGTQGYAQQPPSGMQQVWGGTIVEVHPVNVEGTTSGMLVGGATGAVAGAALGNKIGKGTGKKVATVLGGTAGAAGGAAVGNAVTSERGQELIIRLDDGRMVNITQKDQGFAPGQRVNVLTGGIGTPSRVLLQQQARY